MPDNIEAINLLRGDIGKLSSSLDKTTRMLTLIEAIERDKQKKQDLPLAKEIAISANDEWESPTVNNPEYNRAKIFLNAGFTPSHTGGISVDLYYQKQKIKEVLRVKSPNGSTGGASEAIDIAHLSGFHFRIKNHNTSNSTTITGFKIVMYKEDM